VNSAHYHLAGVAGAGMSALAQALLHAGQRVTGSDRYYDAGRPLETLEKLRAAGVRLVRQDGGGVTPETAGLVVSTAIEAENADLAAARRLNVPVIHRAEMLARLLEDKRAVAVTGTSGKSTVTGLIGWMLEQAGWNPTVVNGAPVLNWTSPSAIGNFRPGGELWVFEADESDRSLLRYRPEWAVITNASSDHFDLESTIELFRRFTQQARKGVVSALDEAEAPAAGEVAHTAAGMRFVYQGERFDLPLRGAHNVANALLAIRLCERLGLAPASLRGALQSFRGIQRRLETVGRARSVTVVDDYAHNPAKVRAAWRALAEGCPRVLGVWRPHGYGPLAHMLGELTEAFAEVCRPQDRLFVLPVFDAGGTADRSVHAGLLVDRLRERGLAAEEAPEGEELAERIAAAARPGDTVAVMGARDPGLPALARRILAALG